MHVRNGNPTDRREQIMHRLLQTRNLSESLMSTLATQLLAAGERRYIVIAMVSHLPAACVVDLNAALATKFNADSDHRPSGTRWLNERMAA